MDTEIENFDLKHKWVLWFHKVNDNNWSIDSYSKVFEIKTYYDILFVIKVLFITYWIKIPHIVELNKICIFIICLLVYENNSIYFTFLIY